MKEFKGAGGGKKSGSSSSSVRTPDNLRSKDTVEAILAISEGPIFGLEEGDKSFYVGETPLQNQDGTYNFENFSLRFYNGLDEPEDVVPNLGGFGNNENVGVTLSSGVPVTRQTSTRNIDVLEVRLVWNQLYASDDNGVYNAEAKFSIEVKKSNSSDWAKLYDEDIILQGKTTSNYVKEFRIPVEKNPDFDYDIRVTKISPDSTETYFSSVIWESFQEIIQEELNFPNTSIVQLTGQSSDQFSSVPNFSGIYRGVLIKVPDNYDPIAKTYTGDWNGTFKIVWSDNPAWILYDFVMNERYGIKSYYSGLNLDKFDVYEAGQWCDELVPDGEGGFQPRYTFNLLIQEPQNGKELANYIAGSFGATFFDDLNGTAFLKIDKDEESTHIFSRENVYEGLFNYSYTDASTRYNDFTVVFINPNLNWIEDRRRIYSQELIDKNGRVPYDFVAVGCINEHEAIRKTWLRLITANTEICTISFSTNRIAGFLKPFDIILVCDPDMGYGISGRIKDIDEDRTCINLRDPVYLETGVTYDISIMLTNATIFKTRLVEPDSGYNLILKLQDELPLNVPDKAVFSIESPNTAGFPRPFRILTISEKDGSADTYEITAVNVNRNKWYDADNITNSGTIKYSVLPNPLNPPGPEDVSFYEYFSKENVDFRIVVNPTFNRGAYKYFANDHSFEVHSRLANTNEPFIKRDLVLQDVIINHPPGLHEFKILGKSYLGAVSDINTVASFFFEVTNYKDPPQDVPWIRINKKEIYWGWCALCEDERSDFKGFEVRYNNNPNELDWENATAAHEGFLTETSFYTNLIPSSARVILVKSIDYFDIYSENAAYLVKDLPVTYVTNEVDRISFTPGFEGTKTGCSVVSGELVADDTGGLLYSGNPNALVYTGGDFYEATYEQLTYEDEFEVTSEGEFIVDIDFEGIGYSVVYKPASQTEWLPVVEGQILEVGTYDIRIDILGGKVRGKIIELDVVIDAEDIIEDFADLEITNATNGIRLPLVKEYSIIKIVSVSIQGDTSAVGYKVIDKNPSTGPLIKLIDIDGNFVTGTFDATIKGFK